MRMDHLQVAQTRLRFGKCATRPEYAGTFDCLRKIYATGNMSPRARLAIRPVLRPAVPSGLAGSQVLAYSCVGTP